MLTAAIDVWNLAKFDEELSALLRTYGTTLLQYQVTSRTSYEEQQAAHGWVPLKDNPFAADRMFILEQIMMPALEQRTIRAWHYTRLTDGEVDRFRVNGIQTSDLKGIRRRLDEQVAAGALDSAIVMRFFVKALSMRRRVRDSESSGWCRTPMLPPTAGWSCCCNIEVAKGSISS